VSLWSDPGGARARPGAARKGEAHVHALERVKQWTRERFALDEAETVMVSEVERSLPGFPPRETQVGFWTADGTRHHFRVFKPVMEVDEGDLPPAWMKAALASDGFDCECC
jgi:nitrate reductase delta subunit